LYTNPPLFSKHKFGIVVPWLTACISSKVPRFILLDKKGMTIEPLTFLFPDSMLHVWVELAVYILHR
jgi:hypothetical protein